MSTSSTTGKQRSFKPIAGDIDTEQIGHCVHLKLRRQPAPANPRLGGGLAEQQLASWSLVSMVEPSRAHEPQAVVSTKPSIYFQSPRANDV